MVRFQAEDLVYVKPLGHSEGGSGTIRSISGNQCLVEFEGGQKDWYHEDLIELLQRDKPFKPTKAPRQTGWFLNPELRESILDAWYKLSKKTFMDAFESFEGFGASMLEWLKETNPELYKSAYVKGHELLGITIYYKK